MADAARIQKTRMLTLIVVMREMCRCAMGERDVADAAEELDDPHEPEDPRNPHRLDHLQDVQEAAQARDEARAGEQGEGVGEGVEEEEGNGGQEVDPARSVGRSSRPLPGWRWPRTAG